MAENGKGEFWAFVAGALAGGIAALLYAPAKGEETRRIVKSTTDDLYGRGEELYTKYRAEGEKLLAEGKKLADEVSTAGREKYEETMEKLEELKVKIEGLREKHMKHAEEAPAEEKTAPKASAKSAKKK